jgi:hypothetical protein
MFTDSCYSSKKLEKQYIYHVSKQFTLETIFIFLSPI